MKFFIASEDDEYKRLDKFLTKKGIAFGVAHKMIRAKRVVVNGQIKEGKYQIKSGDKITVNDNLDNIKTKSSKKIQIGEQKLKIVKDSIIYQDEHIIIFDKPSGIAVQSGSKNDFSVDSCLPFLKFDSTTTPRLVHSHFHHFTFW